MHLIDCAKGQCRNSIAAFVIPAFLLICSHAVKAAIGPETSSAGCAAGLPADEAITGCTKALSLPDVDPTTRASQLAIRGSAYFVLRDYALASADFKNALAIAYQPNLSFLLAVSEYNAGDNAEAISELSKIVDSGAATAQIFHIRGMAYQNAGDFDASIADFSRELALNPKAIMALNNRAAAYSKKGDFLAAKKDIDALLAINPNMPAALTNRCLFLAKQGNFDAGRKDCDQAEKLGADNPDIIVSIGAAYYLAKRYEDAVRYYNHALQLSPNHPFALYSRGIAEAKLGQDEQSKTDLSEAARIMPNVGAIMESAGMK